MKLKTVKTFEIFETYKAKIIERKDPDGNAYLCGHIAISQHHPFYRDKANKMGIKCHNGISYGQREDDYHWIGFSCNGASDYIKNTNELGGRRDETFIEKELEKIAHQLDEAGIVATLKEFAKL